MGPAIVAEQPHPREGEVDPRAQPALEVLIGSALVGHKGA